MLVLGTNTPQPPPFLRGHSGSERQGTAHRTCPSRSSVAPGQLNQQLWLGSAARKGKGAARTLALALDAATEQHRSNYSNGVSAQQ